MAKKKTTSKYNFILKEFTKLNKKLPAERKLSYKQRRDIVKNQILPQFADVPKSRIGKRRLKAAFNLEISTIPSKEICDINYIDVSEFALVEWFSLDETIRELVPDCVFVKISGGDYGETRIFNTRDYEYGSNGVRSIVEAIRPDAENVSGRYIFSAYKKLRPRKRNNGNPENYYLDFVLVILDTQGNQMPMASTESVEFELPKTREVRKKKTKVKNLIEGRIKKLKAKRESKKRAKKTLEKNLTKFTQIIKKKPTKINQNSARKQFLQTSKLLEKYYAEGKLTKYQYEKALEKLLKEFNEK